MRRIQPPDQQVEMTHYSPLPTPPRMEPSQVRWPAGLWLVGLHGGAGATTLASTGIGLDGGGRHWPRNDGQPTGVLFVCRASSTGLTAASHAGTAVQRREVPPGVTVVGLVIVAAQPGRLPKIVRERAELVGGWFPKVWRMPWVPEVIAMTPQEVRYSTAYRSAIPAELFTINDRGRTTK